MKQLIILFSVLCFVCNAKAQDKLITQKGDVKTVYVVEIGQNNIFYKLENKEGASLQQIGKKEVVMIIHTDGTKEIFNTGDTSTPKVETPQNNAASTSQTDRHPVIVKNDNFVPVKFIDEKKKGKNKKANIFYLLYQFKNGSIIGDDNLSVEYKIIGYMDDSKLTSSKVNLVPEEDPTKPHFNYSLKVILQNKSDKTIYIDLGNTYISRGEEATAYYIPSATSTGKETSTGGSVNLGSISNAIGVGGAAGSILSGVNVGGSSSNLSTTTTYSQRIISIPPKSKKTLENQLIFPLGSESLYNNNIQSKKAGCYIDTFTPLENKIKEGDSLEFDENNSPINFSSYITYSFHENCTETSFLNTQMYIKQIIGFRCTYNIWTGLSNKDYDKSLSSDWKNRMYFLFSHS